jgi:hypothetical protein
MIRRRAQVLLLLLPILAVGLAPVVQTSRAQDVAATRTDAAQRVGSLMADAASRFLAVLDDGQRARASFPFDSPERLNWHWIPRERKGLPLKDLRPDQEPVAFGLLGSGLSPRGDLTATTIMSLEEILRVQEKGTGPVRDPELYFISVFGTPGDTAGWGWRVEGHHLSLNFTLKGGQVVACTPFMLGSNPATVKEAGPRQGLRNLAAIETPLDALLTSLTPEQKRAIVVGDKAPGVTSGPNSAQIDAPTLAGLGADQLTSDQRQTLADIVRAYAATFPAPVEAILLDQLARSESTLHIAWTGPLDRTQNHAFRILGPTLLIDFNNTQNGVNHIHTFYRAVGADFGL